MRSFTSSPQPGNYQILKIDPPASGGDAPEVVSATISDCFTVFVPSTATYDTVANPLRIPGVFQGMFFSVVNNQATDLLVKGPKPTDPGFIVQAGTTGFGATDGRGNIVEIDSSAAGGGGIIFVSNLAELGLVPDAGLSNGAIAWVNSRRAYFTLDHQSSAPLLTGQIVATDSTLGRWIRLIDASVGTWASPNNTTVTIDPVNGNDDNDGIANPLATIAEARWRGWYGCAGPSCPRILNNVTVVVNSPTLDENIDVEVEVEGTANLVIQGTNTPTRQASTFTAFTARNRATNTPNNGADGVNAFTAGDVGKLINITASVSGAAGSFAVILAVTAGTARFGSFVLPTPFGAEKTVSNGDTYIVLSPTLLGAGKTIKASCKGKTGTTNNGVWILNFQTQNGVPAPAAYSQMDSNVSFINCLIGTTGGGINGLGRINFQNCLAKPGTAYTGSYFFVAGGTIGNISLLGPGIDPVFTFGYLLQAGTLFIGQDTFVPGVFVEKPFQWLNIQDMGIFDWPSPGAGVTGAAIVIEGGSKLQLYPVGGGGGLWGVSANANTFVMDIARGQVTLGSGLAWATFVTCVGAAPNKDFTIRGNATSFAFDRVAAAFVAPAINNTFALLDTAVAGGGFGGATIDPASGDGLSQAVL